MQIDEEIIAQYNGSFTGAWTHMLTRSHIAMVMWIENVISNIVSTGDTIDAICLFATCRSLEDVASSKGIPIIHTDIAPIRNPTYRTLGYLDFIGTQGKKNEVSQRYTVFKNEFNKSSNRYIVSLKEILALLLSDEYLYKLNMFGQQPTYEWGFALSPDIAWTHAFNNSYGQLDFLFDIVNSNIDVFNSLIRSHPSDWFMIKPFHWKGNFDESPDTETFILQCKRVATTWSKSAFLAMLWGRFVHIIKSPNSAFVEGASQSFNIEDSKQVDVAFINFITFGYFVPLEYLNDPKYLKWRLAKPTETEIYMKNLSYCFSQIGIDLDVYFSIPYEDVRLAYLLNVRQQPQIISQQSTIHETTTAVAKEILDKYRTEIDNLTAQVSALAFEKEEAERKINTLFLEKETTQQKFNAIIDSTSWKVTRPMRWIKRKLVRR